MFSKILNWAWEAQDSNLPIYCFFQCAVQTSGRHRVTFSWWGTIPNTHTLEEKRFTLAHSLSGFSLWRVGSNTETAWWKDLALRKVAYFMAVRSQAERGRAEEEDVLFQAMHPVTWVFTPGPNTSQQARHRQVFPRGASNISLESSTAFSFTHLLWF